MSTRKNTALLGVEAEPDAVGALEIAEIEIRRARRHLAPVREQRHVEPGERLPAVLDVDRQRVVVAEAVVRDAAQRVAAADRRLHVERHRLARRRRSSSSARPRTREHPLLVEDREELLEIERRPLKVVAIEVEIASSRRQMTP